jgi:hypothetical protein
MMSQDKRNPFGGKNPHGMYVPLTDDELEVIERIAQAGEFKVVIKGWGHVTGFVPGRYDPATYQGQPIVSFGDKNIHFYFRLNYSAPALPQPNWFFDMEVWALGHVLFRQRMPTEHGGKPIQIVAGVFHDLALDVGLDKIDPGIVKEIKPRAIGLTTRHGNMHLDLHHQRLLAQTRAGERSVREMSAADAKKATDKMKKATGR